MKTDLDVSFTDIGRNLLAKENVEKVASDYLNLHDQKNGGTVDVRKENYMQMVNAYYDLVTDFYEYGWGQSFHFAPRHAKESFESSIVRHEMFLALRLGLRPGMRVLDVGCGVGGPMRTIARFSKAHITGVNNNDYQIKRGRRHNENAGLTNVCDFLKADFMSLPVADATYDAAYAIEATCHAPDKVALFSEINRVLKPGQSFAGYEWCITDLYDPASPKHRQIKKDIEEGDALPDLVHPTEVIRALEAAGFEIVESCDLAVESDVKTPWYLPLQGSGLSAFRRTPAGRWFTTRAVGVLERLKLAPKGSVAVSKFLNTAADALVAGGQTGIFTPMFYFHARKKDR